MCQWGDDVMLEVPTTPDGSETKLVGIDRCIAPIVDALNARGIYTLACCCGHGRDSGSIMLHDGRTLAITKSRRGERLRAEDDFWPAALSVRARNVLANYAIDSKEKLLALNVDDTVRWKNGGPKFREQIRTAQRALKGSASIEEMQRRGNFEVSPW
jgi:hypothetical protein